MTKQRQDVLGTLKTVSTGSSELQYYDLRELEAKGLIRPLDSYPVSIRILMENILRNVNGKEVFEEDVKKESGSFYP